MAYLKREIKLYCDNNDRDLDFLAHISYNIRAPITQVILTPADDEHHAVEADKSYLMEMLRKYGMELDLGSALTLTKKENGYVGVKHNVRIAKKSLA
jgi:hypothetical protein